MPKARELLAEEAARVGLCVRCRHGSRQESKRGSAFWRCLRADADPGYPRYARLPVRDCEGHEERQSE